jgi:enamine deaminase RidA (YjgF/YER057c/UK114 family)
MTVEQRLAELGIELPSPPLLPPGVEVPFAWVRVLGDRAFVSGHGALRSGGSPAGPFGWVPDEVSLEDAQASARLAAAATLSALRRTLGDLGRIQAWLTVNGFVNAEPGYAQTTVVLNPFSGSVLEVFGPESVATLELP